MYFSDICTYVEVDEDVVVGLEVEDEVEIETEVEVKLEPEVSEVEVKLEPEVYDEVYEVETEVTMEKVFGEKKVVVEEEINLELLVEEEMVVENEVVEEDRVVDQEEADIAYKCTSCPKFYRSSMSLDRHKKLECGKEPGQLCHLCTYITKQPSNLTRHLALKHNLIPDNQAISHAFESRICFKCGGTFKTKNSLDDHLRYTCGQKPTRICPYCDYKGLTPSQLNAHMKRIHKVTPVRKVRSCVDNNILQLQSYRVSGGYKCPSCERVLKCVYGLRRHLIKVCSRVKSEFCTFCSYKNKDTSNLLRHMSLKHQLNKKKGGRPKKIWLKKITNLK